jgi:hypothetical protein
MAKVFTEAMAHELCQDVHGSGLDGEPFIRESRKNVVIHWSYHMMDDGGYYCGYWRFVVWIPKAHPQEFRLTGRRGNPKCASAYGLKDYLEDVFVEAIRVEDA